MADTIMKSFLVRIGFDLDGTSKARAEAAVAQTEARITKAGLDEIEKRKQAENRAASERVGAAEKTGDALAEGEARLTDAARAELDKRRRQQERAEAERIEAAVKAGRELTAEEKAAAGRITARQKAEAEKRAHEAERQAKEKAKLEEKHRQDEQKRRDQALKDTQASALKVAKVIAGAFALKEAKDQVTGLVSMVDQAAQGFERLGYASRQSGASPTKIGAFGYAAGQLGAEPGTAQSQLVNFGNLLETYQGYREHLQGEIGTVSDEHGNLLDTGDLATRLGKRLREVRDREGLAQSRALASSFGFDDFATQRAMMDEPAFGAREKEFATDQAKAGADPDATAKSGTEFEQSLRSLRAAIDAVGTAIQDKLQTVLKPQLDNLTAWVQQHAVDITAIATSFVDGVTKLVASLVGSDGFQSAVNSFGDGLRGVTDDLRNPEFRKSVKTFFDDIGVLAGAIHSALRVLGFANEVVPADILNVPKKAVEDTISGIKGAVSDPGSIPANLERSNDALNKALERGWDWLTSQAPLVPKAAAATPPSDKRRLAERISGGLEAAGDEPHGAATPSLPAPRAAPAPIPAATDSRAWWQRLLPGWLGGGSTDDRRTKTAILETAEATKKLAEAAERAESSEGGFGDAGGDVGGSDRHAVGADGPGARVGDHARGLRQGGSRSWRNNNPGNITMGEFARGHGADSSDGKFAHFPSYEAGRKAQEDLWFNSKLYAGMTLAQAVAQWSPPSENDTAGILRRYAGAVGVDPSTPLSQFTPDQRGKLLDAQQAREGWHAGVAGVAVPGGSPGTAASAVDIANGLTGDSSRQAAEALRHKMTDGEWCADFVNGVFAKAGITGSGSSASQSFKNWGKAVDAIASVRKGDVIVEDHGGGHGHVGLATGSVRRDAEGRVTAIGMVSGNHGGVVRGDYWESVDKIAALRRAYEVPPPAAPKDEPKPASRDQRDDYRGDLPKLADYMNPNGVLTTDRAAQYRHDRQVALASAYEPTTHFDDRREDARDPGLARDEAELKRARDAMNRANHPNRPSPFGVLGTYDPATASRPSPLGDTPALHSTIDNSTKGDTVITHNPTFNIKGPDMAAAMSAARLTASRGQQDLLRNVQGAEQ